MGKGGADSFGGATMRDWITLCRRAGEGLLQPFTDLLWPRHCEGCGGVPEEGGGHICWDCRSRLPWIGPPYCRRCGDPVEGAITGEYVCSLCTAHEPFFDAARSAVRFREGVKDWLHRFKYSQATHLAGDLGELLAAVVQAHYADAQPDAVAYVPLHPLKERERTYNQSGLLAKSLAAHMGLPVARACLERVRNTGSQTHLTARQRGANVAGAFQARYPEWVESRRFLLVDDVMTTGATVNECARALKVAGAAQVLVATVARG